MSIHTLFIMITSEVLVVSSFTLLVRFLMRISIIFKDPVMTLAKLLEVVEGAKNGTEPSPPLRSAVFDHNYEQYKIMLEKNLLPWPMLLLLVIVSGGILMLWS